MYCGVGVFIVESSSAKAGRKMSVLMALALLVTGSFGLLLTMQRTGQLVCRSSKFFRAWKSKQP
jgi:hypothetical protein